MNESSILKVDLTDHATGSESHHQIPVSFIWFEKLQALVSRFVEQQTKSRVDVADLKFANPNISGDLEKTGKFESVVLFQSGQTVKILVATGNLEKEEIPPTFKTVFVKNPSSAWISKNADRFFRDLSRLKYIGVPHSLASEFFDKWKVGLLS